ncbi:MAG: hypothetical protein ACRDBP_16780 [Luteolibacter sp.]
MKFSSIKRAVRASSHERAAGDAPNIGRVARMPGTGIPKVRRRRRGGRGKSGKGLGPGGSLVSKLWTILLAGAVVVSLGAVLFLWVRSKISEEIPGARQAGAGSEEQVAPETRVPSPSEQEATALVKRAIAVRDPALVEDLFRLGGSSPDEVVKFLEGLESVDGKVEDFGWLSSVDVNRMAVDGVAVRFEDSTGPRNRLALLTPDASGKWKLDFESFARTVRPGWQDIMEKPFETALVRVFFAKDNYYNGPFKDEEKWICLGLKSPDKEEVFFGYCQVGTPQAAAINWISDKMGNSPSRVTLELRQVEGAGRLQFEVSRVLAEDWIVGDAPFDDGFR